MEIISFVSNESNSSSLSKFYKKTSGSFNFKTKERKTREPKNLVNFSFDYDSDEIHSFTAGKVKKTFSVKNILASIGRGCTSAVFSIKKHIKGIFVTLAFVILAGAGAFASLYYVNYKTNHTGPVEFAGDDSLDIESLNQIMAAFALEKSVGIDEEGNILGEDFVSDVLLFEQPVTFQNYKVVAGDTISGIAKKFGLKNISSLISINHIENVRFLGAGQKLKIPSIDGIVYTVKAGDSLQLITQKNNIKMETLLDVNELVSEELAVGQELFLPGVGLDSTTLRSAMGELFKLPIHTKFKWSSPYGKRIDPIKGIEAFHTGTDMACATGTPIYAAMSGTVTFTGTSNIFGKYVIIDHGNGYQTLYAHMSKIISTKGQFVGQNTRIGLVGSTGYSTGPHLHFTVYKNGKIINPMTVLNNAK